MSESRSQGSASSAPNIDLRRCDDAFNAFAAGVTNRLQRARLWDAFRSGWLAAQSSSDRSE
jgi:hypothetical protein